MKNCPNCQSVNEECYDHCWKCQYSFIQNESISAQDPVEDNSMSDEESVIVPDLVEDIPGNEDESISAPDFKEEHPYSNEEDKILFPSDSQVFCQNCNKEVDSSYLFCPYCQHQMENKSLPSSLSINGRDLNIDCLRCGSSMYFRGVFKFHEGRRVGAMGNVFELFTIRETYDLYFCSKCRKVEFFLPRAKKSKEKQKT